MLSYGGTTKYSSNKKSKGEKNKKHKEEERIWTYYLVFTQRTESRNPILAVKLFLFKPRTHTVFPASETRPSVFGYEEEKRSNHQLETAMADKPSRALVLYGDGVARFVDQSHLHLHAVASKSACGFLSLPNAPPSESEDERIVREFAYLVDACEAYQDVKSLKNTSAPTLSERFMGLKAAIITNNPSLKSFSSQLGLTVLSTSDLNGSDVSPSGASVGFVTSQLLKLLGFQDGKVLEASQFDLVFVHFGAGERSADDGGNATASDVEYLDELSDGIMRIVQPSSEIGARLHLSVVMSYGRVNEADSTNFSVLPPKNEMSPDLAALCPRQSYTMRGETPRDDVRHHCPMLIAQWQSAVTRIDLAESFSFADFKERGVNLVIPADRFLHEVAFKLWKAPKYGA
ncbi:hypothetical protein Tsubulata_037849 [Turnera subulata]|uniref:Uncharacterized protein n=1 Tax=Turnera subulata TaxID=218843 RepID=A0A9Q0FX85_9ROSI|nr:hypothetical protein Tsubulata_037849 [Turnera subulata]